MTPFGQIFGYPVGYLFTSGIDIDKGIIKNLKKIEKS
jgi:hypothetical protein